MDTKQSVNFTINGVPHVVSGDIPSGTSLNVYIRDHAQLHGTKAMCHEGGCGACIVAAKIKGETMAVNSCLVPILICDGWAIETIEGIGNPQDGYNTIQTVLAAKNGSQCGFCSPGMVMNMYSLTQNKSLTMREIENSFGSNICRCTGYRPILDAFKGLANDALPELVQDIRDIEELYNVKTCPKNGLPCSGNCTDKDQSNNHSTINMKLDDAEFYKVNSINDLFAIFQQNPTASYILNGGNTAHGVYRTQKSDIYIDVNDIPDLHHVEKNDHCLTLGGNVSLTTAMQIFEKYSSNTGFKYLQHLINHMDLIASVPVRNIGTIAGNLMIKHTHHEFPSDVFLILETVGTEIHILKGPGQKQSLMLQDFLATDMRHKIIYSVVLPALSSEYEYRSYKIMPRAQNAHAHVNAGFLFKLDGGGKVLEKPNIIYGGINPNFLHASKTENYLVGKSIIDKQVLKVALETLHKELQPDHVLPDYSPEFRRTLAEGLFYKFVLSFKPDNVNAKLRSGGTMLKRNLSSGKQDYEIDKSIWPVGEPVIKKEAIHQTTGQAQYCNDLPSFPKEVFCAFAITRIGNGKIESINATKALAIKGVLAFFTAKDVPGKNLAISAESKQFMLISDEELFVEKNVLYAGQPVGVIVAETQNLANEAANLVEVKYSESLTKTPVISIEDAINSMDDTRLMQTAQMSASRKGTKTKHVIQGVFQCGSQYHYTMETQSCVCVPLEDGIDVYPTTQWIDLTQGSIAQCLGLKQNSINIHVRRLGGAYGSKISRNVHVACACALVCYKLNRPARFVMSLENNMMSVGKRVSSRQKYEIGVDDNGVIQYLDSVLYSNAGCSFNEPHGPLAVHHMANCYIADNWKCDGLEARTDTPSNTFCRAPGSTEALGMIEHIMEHIARTTNKNPTQIRLSNMNDTDKSVLEPMIQNLCKSADYDARKKKVETFNEENRWKKKGIALVPMKYPLMFFGQFNAMVSICARDGTVIVTHGGIESGQGINTKVAQAAAHAFNIDLDSVIVKPTNNIVTPNNAVTGGSITSESCVQATLIACEEIKKRLEPIKKELDNPSWKELVLTAHLKDIDLCARHMFTITKDDSVKPYNIYGVTIAEVEIDLLTGQHIINRVDLMEDVGNSLSPMIDIGQLEGAFVMGIGYWTAEDVVHDPKTGMLTNYRTWNYKPPGVKDIPVDFNVYFRKDAPNPFGILRSKATGEPALCMSCVIPIAIRYALNSARSDCGNTEAWYQMDGPFTTERILQNSLTSKDNMSL